MRLPEILEAMREEEILIICADHGNDPEHTGWDHTREYVPLIVTGEKIKHDKELKTRKTFADVGATVAQYLEAEPTNIGESFLKEILK